MCIILIKSQKQAKIAFYFKTYFIKYSVARKLIQKPENSK